MTGIAQDLRYAFRGLMKAQGFTALAVVTLALGIGLATALFSVIDGVLLRRLPWRDPDRLVTIWIVRPHWRSNPLLSRSWDQGTLSWPNYTDLERTSQTLEQVAVWRRAQPVLTTDVNEVTKAMFVSSTFLPLLGTMSHMGRFFVAREDEEPTDSIIVSYETWQQRFGGDEQIVGRNVTLDNTRRTIVGVLPPRFRFEGVPAPLEFLLPFGNELPATRTRTNHAFSAVARLKAGVTLEDAFRDIEPLVRAGESAEQLTARVERLEDTQLGSSRRPLWTLFAAAALLLLIACANVAGLLIGAAGARRQEIAVRGALGASRGRLVRERLVESFVLAAAGAVFGLVVAWLLTPVLVAFAPVSIPRIDSVRIDHRVLLFSIAATLATTLLFGGGPAFVTSRHDPIEAVRHGRHSALGRSRVRGWLVAAEVAVAFVLLVGTVLMGETLLRLKGEPLGFDPARLVAVSIRRPPGHPSKSTHTLGERLKALPGVEAVGAAASVPFLGGFSSNMIDVDGEQTRDGVPAFRHHVTSGYFTTMRVPLLKGRYFEDSDAGREPVAIVSRSFERQYLNGQALNRQLRVSRKSDEWYRIIGVVTDAKQLSIAMDIGPAFYLLNESPSQFVLRSTAAPDMLMREIGALVRSHDPNLIVATMPQLVRRTIAPQELGAMLAGLFGGAALLLAAVGLYALVSRSVIDRTAEIGLRMALGAQSSDVLRLIASQGGLPVVAGVFLGVPAAFLGARAISSVLYGVTPTSPHVFLTVVGVLVGTAFVAMVWPARRAARVDPLVALRYE